MPESAYSMVLRRAAEELCGIEPLRARLRVSRVDLEAWLAGAGTPSMPVFLEALDIGMARLQRLHRHCDTLRSSARAALKQAQAIRGRLATDMLQATLEATLCATGADMGNVQLAHAKGLRIIAQRGFEQPFLDYFSCVDDERSACGAAMRRGRRIVIPDIASDPMFADTPAERVMARAAVRAVQSTPLLAAGQLVGVLSTHYAAPYSLSRRDEETLDRMARRAASWLRLQRASVRPELLGVAGR
jgi:GAF domain-containing protein